MQETYKTYARAATFLLIAAILFSFDRLGVTTSLKKAFSPPLEFVQIPVFFVKNNLISKVNFVVNLRQIDKENLTLSQELAQSLAENAKLESISLENLALRDQLAFFSDRQIKSQAARVLNLSEFLTILPEQPKTVKVGSAVLLGANFVGVVVDTGAKFAKVRLPTDPASSIPAVIQTPSGVVRGILVGKYGKMMSLEKIEKQEIVPADSVVQTTGDEQLSPGFVLGKVAKVDNLGAAPFLNIQVESFVDFGKITTVFVINQ